MPRKPPRASSARVARASISVTDAASPTPTFSPDAFLDFVGRVLDVSPIREEAAKRDLPPEVRRAIEAKTVTEGMTYQMVLLSFGEPEQKKINDSQPGTLSETWYYMKDGQRWVLEFTNGKVTKVQKY